ncbi:MAG: MFS transporter [Nocardioides sp.]
MSPPRPLPALSPSRARLGVSLLFFTNGALLSALLPRYPEFKSAFGLSNSEFGFLVVAFGLGAILAAGFAGRSIRRFGTRRTSAVGSTVLAGALALAGCTIDLTHGLWIFVAATLVAGAVDAVVDAAQNVQGVLVEEWRQKSVLNSFHALWSTGAATGGVVGAVSAAANVHPGVQMVASGIVWAAVAILAARLAAVPAEVSLGLDPESTAAPVGHIGSVRPRAWRLLMPLVTLAICGTLIEDVANNWAVLYLTEETEAPTALAGLGLTVALASQFVGRMLGDPMTDRWGRAAVARSGGLVIAAGALLIVLAPSYLVAFAGFALAGFGSATLVPAAFAAAGRIPGLAEGTGIAILGWLMRLGFLLTSPIIGWVSDLSSLRVAMLIGVGAGLLAVLVARSLRRPASAFQE